MDRILETLKNLEPIFHAACPEANTDHFERLVSSDFWEVGASGCIYNREFALNTVKNRSTTPSPNMWETSDHAVQKVGEYVYLLTYTLRQPNRITRRLTVWHYCDNSWQAVYHQGTAVIS